MNLRNRSLRAAILILAASLVRVDIVSAQSSQGNPISALLLSPNVVMKHRNQLGLTEDQVQQIHASHERAAAKADAAQQQINEATGRLAKLLSADNVEEESTLKQVDELFAAENKLKRLHMQIMIQVRNVLTSEQRKMATQLQRKHESDDNTERRLTAKLNRIQNEVKSRSERAQPPYDAVGLMQKFPELMRNGQVREAEALLDRVTKMLGLGLAGNPRSNVDPNGLQARITGKIQRIQQRAQAMQQKGEDVSEIQQLMERIAPLMQQGKVADAEKLIDQALKLTGEITKPGDDKGASLPTVEPLPNPSSLGDLQAEITALKKPDVAWRKIAWKTCLIDGLAESRKRNKPIMLWIFIDRPIDDERC